ncbi:MULTISPECIES: carbamoyl phosphate synthase small subunit [Neobacillus]|uniref:Carbamoyl phosphate synthase small chain n=1 Tax=Neobacillus rhizophilus TaxID=2833579 RepID=A0A942U731_9BACI|nr:MULTISPECIES: carbamoyl phosphate synthase small subunit [Neobacillus]MBS4213498.1 carbamoyl phosphate synthase small subunit [Neobacillus rhizophilus]MBU8918092.1 carbamoyl phosphate synthase small subunit [Bacillus sp. FJAT-29953]
MEHGYLTLETGEVFEGVLIGANNESLGEVVFNTSMTGYQEIITDPSYAGQIITFCYPIIGNYGINALDDESISPALAGVVIGDLCETPSHYQSFQKFSEKLKQAGVPGIVNVDTRLLVKTIRSRGTVKGYISKKIEESFPLEEKTPLWVDQVSTKKVQFFKNNGPHVVLMDFGYKKSILTALLAENCAVTVVPYNTPFEKIKSLEPDGVLISNGPGDPMSLQKWFPEIKKISQNYPTLGICLGHQLIALAYGAKTEKLAYGHRGGNHPVKELMTGKVKITAQNHGYVVVDNSIDEKVFNVTYRNVNDKSIEGLTHKNYQIQTVQFHPEAHPGPSDTTYILTEFVSKIASVGETRYAIK